MTTWLVIGSAPSVLATLPLVRPQLPGTYTVITCNSGIKLWPVPDYYVLVDQRACESFAEVSRQAQQRGTTLVTLYRDNQRESLLHFDRFIRMDAAKAQPTRRSYGAFRYSGPLCVEFALRSGATEVWLVGMDGYADKKNDYFDAECTATLRRSEKNLHHSHTIPYLQPRLNTLAGLWPEVKFRQWGNPCFSVGHPNWLLMS